MVKLSLVVFWVLITCTTFSQEVINISFVKDGKEIIIDEDFQVFFVGWDSSKKVIIQPVIRNSSFQFPVEYTQIVRSIVFQHKKNAYAITVSEYDLNADNKRWVLHFDKKPYNEEYHYGKEMYDKKYKGILLLEHGRVNSISYISNIKAFIKDSKKILK